MEDLQARGLVADCTDPEAVAQLADEGEVSVYCGFDPTADSLHVGNLQALMLLRRFQNAGHRVIALVGGATGRIGDPGGRDEERPMLDDATIDHNVAAIKRQFGRFVSFESTVAGQKPAALVDNREWTGQMTLIEFLRDVGKFASVNVMMSRDSVKNRIGREGGLSFTEFTYQLVQANDFRHLHDHLGCNLQVAGSDQWGNIVAGVDLVRRTRGDTVHGLTAPLIVDSDGKKFGKSTGGGQLWLDPAKTSPYAMYQYFVRTPDDLVLTLLLRLTLLEVADCHSIAEAHLAAPEQRAGQRRLAHELLTLIHGAAAAAAAERASAILFGGDASEAAAEVWAMLSSEVPTVGYGPEDDLASLAVRAGVVRSKSEVRRNPSGLRLNGEVRPGDSTPQDTDVQHGRYSLLRWGKGNYVVLDATRDPFAS